MMARLEYSAAMTSGDLDRWFRGILDFEGMAQADPSLNGLQVGRADAEVRRVAFAVDACLEAFRRAAEAGADLLFVHHGLFWGKPLAVTGTHYERLAFLIERKLGLYACHLPLDAHPELGNNACLAGLLGLTELEPFGLWHGKEIGFRGRLAQPIDLDEALRRVLPDGSRPLAVQAFGPRQISTAAVISGGASHEAIQALEAGVDLYVTGEPSHDLYHLVEEGRMNLIAAGHYATETWGVKALSERLSRDTGLETLFIPLPTGL